MSLEKEKSMTHKDIHVIYSSMNKDFSKEKLLEMDDQKKIKALFDLASFIESHGHNFSSPHFKKLEKYHIFLSRNQSDLIEILNKEFLKITAIDYQFQIYLMNLERFLGQSSKDYQFLIRKDDKKENLEAPFKIKVLLDSVRSAHNIGSIIRNCECFNIEELILTGLSPLPTHPQVIKTAMGCEENIKWSYSKNACDYIHTAKNQGYTIWAIETGKEAQHLHSLKGRPEKLIILFGHEQFGLSLELIELADKIIDIKLFGQKNSLNVSISNAVVLQTLVNLGS